MEDILDVASKTDLFLDGVKNWFLSVFPSFINAVLVIFIGWYLARILNKFILKAMKRSKLDDSIVFFLNSIVKVLLKAFVILSSLATLGVDVTSMVAAIGAAGVTAGLAVKDTLTNVTSGVLLIIHRPFDIGDYLELEKVQGTVNKIDIMFTTLVTVDNKTIVIPNSIVSSNYMINYSKRGTRRLDLVFSISYNDDVEKARKVIKNVVDLNDMVINKKDTLIVVEANMSSSVDMGVKVWCKSSDYIKLKYILQEDIKKAFEQNGISIPYNQLDIHMFKTS